MSADYVVPAGPVCVETQVKKSRFIAFLAPVSSRQEAQDYIASLRLQFPDATHHCSAFVAGAPGGGAAEAFDDDGEPSGTAGRPMLNVLQHKQIGEVVAVVVRYFGGVKLGAGGLVRAYGSAVQAACEQLQLVNRIALRQGVLHCSYAREQPVRHALEQHGATIEQCRYDDQVTITVSVASNESQCLASHMRDISRGQIEIHWQEKAE